MSLFDLSGRVALVTGAGGGLGRAICEVLAEQGAAVAMCDLEAASAQPAGHDRFSIVEDLMDDAAPTRIVQAAHAWKGRLDTLVCNAGIQGPAGPLGDASDDAWHAVLQINLRSAVRLATLAAPLMAARGGGSVVLISSIAGLRGNRSIGLYALSKAALAQAARNLAVEWGPRNVRINAVSPGLIRTPLSAHLLADEAFMQRRLAATPLRRVGEPRDVAGVVALLAGGAGAFITGQNLVIDGGTLISDGS